VTNPPFHRGHDVDYEVARFFVSEAARVLKPDGHLFLVANAFLNYGAWLAQHFSVTDIAWEDRQYRVWHAIRRP
jgi:16S rRNA (guanine1207-N2)-methyltransferase